jgi:hydroxyethylthiazole kinase-like uncharacterized protein yjeF
MHAAALGAQPIYRVEQIRAIEAREVQASPPLMERAGAAAAGVALSLTGGTPLPVLVACGPGNNGGDGFVLARRLRSQGASPVVVFSGEPQSLPADARAAYDAWLAAGGTVETAIPRQAFALAVDALFGIGLKRPLDREYAQLVDAINTLGCPVLALDVPSGLDADTGLVMGCAVRASHTATFIGLKSGLLTLEGPDHCGTISVHDLDLAPETLLAPQGRVVAPALFAAHLRPRPKNSHKGMMGAVGILGGAPGMVGAALLAGRAALKLGAGRVYVGLLDRNALAVDPGQPELMLRPPREILAAGQATALALGPGLGQGGAALALLKEALMGTLPLVLDADALNLLAAHPVVGGWVLRREAPCLLTPHPLEAARLLGVETAEVRADRVRAALALAEKFHAPAVLKGCGSIVALPDGRWFVNTSGNAGMASAGMGDVLTGLAATLLAQRWPAEAALLAAAHLHGVAADRLVEEGTGPAGLTAGETIDAAREVFNGWLTG